MFERPFLSGLGWINEFPVGNRLRWYFPLERTISATTFLGLPSRTIIERTIIDVAGIETQFLGQYPSAVYPANWWTFIGNVVTTPDLPSRFTLPHRAQAVRFVYRGSDAVMNIYDSSDQLIRQQFITFNAFVYLEHSDIHQLEFFSASAQLVDVRYLDLFDNHDAGLNFEVIANLATASTVDMPFMQVYRRYSGNPSMDPDEWQEFQQTIVQEALASTPESVLSTPNQPSSWTQFQSLMAIRWEFAQLYSMGFVDGPDTPEGALLDNIVSDNILHLLPIRPLVYRVQCVYNDPPLILRSNPIIIFPFPANSLPSPYGYSYVKTEVKLFGEETYREKNDILVKVPNHYVIGVEIEENFSKSPILGSLAFLDNYIFRSWRPQDRLDQLLFHRSPVLSFYDIPMSFRARSIDAWDRVSEFGEWTSPIIPTFIHNPEPPVPLTAWISGNEVTLVAQTENQSFRDWVPDHAVLNTPDSRLEVMLQIAQPQVLVVNVQAPEPYIGPLQPASDQFSVNIPNTINDPSIFVGGYLIVGNLRANIDSIYNDKFIFSAVSNGAGQAAFFDAGPITLQQAPNHPMLFQVVASFPVTDLPVRLTFQTDLPAPTQTNAVEHYALRVNMIILIGAISNRVSVLRSPEPLETPPPFTVDLLGVDFYDRTLIRIRLQQSIHSGMFTVYFAEGTHSVSSFHEAAVKGDYGLQSAHNGRFLYEIFSMPVPKSQFYRITIGIQAENKGGFTSDFVIEHFNLPIYSQ